jgi:hypothetical protein
MTVGDTLTWALEDAGALSPSRRRNHRRERHGRQAGRRSVDHCQCGVSGNEDGSASRRPQNSPRERRRGGRWAWHHARQPPCQHPRVRRGLVNLVARRWVIRGLRRPIGFRALDQGRIDRTSGRQRHVRRRDGLRIPAVLSANGTIASPRSPH